MPMLLLCQYCCFVKNKILQTFTVDTVQDFMTLIFSINDKLAFRLTNTLAQLPIKTLYYISNKLL